MNFLPQNVMHFPPWEIHHPPGKSTTPVPGGTGPDCMPAHPLKQGRGEPRFESGSILTCDSAMGGTTWVEIGRGSRGPQKGHPREIIDFWGGAHMPQKYDEFPPPQNRSKVRCSVPPRVGRGLHGSLDIGAGGKSSQIKGGAGTAHLGHVCAPPEIDDFLGVPLLSPPGSASDFKAAGTPHGGSNVELYPICKRCSADPLKHRVR